jgi:hypothetical protein
MASMMLVGFAVVVGFVVLLVAVTAAGERRGPRRWGSSDRSSDSGGFEASWFAGDPGAGSSDAGHHDAGSAHHHGDGAAHHAVDGAHDTGGGGHHADAGSAGGFSDGGSHFGDSGGHGH